VERFRNPLKNDPNYTLRRPTKKNNRLRAFTISLNIYEKNFPDICNYRGNGFLCQRNFIAGRKARCQVRLPQGRMAMLLFYLFVRNLFLTIKASTTFAPAAETTSGLMSSSLIVPP
jgi:hypothetical protein